MARRAVPEGWPVALRQDRAAGLRRWPEPNQQSIDAGRAAIATNRVIPMSQPKANVIPQPRPLTPEAGSRATGIPRQPVVQGQAVRGAAGRGAERGNEGADAAPDAGGPNNLVFPILSSVHNVEWPQQIGVGIRGPNSLGKLQRRSFRGGIFRRSFYFL